MRIKRRPTRLEKKAKRGFQGYPIATLCFYGPDNTRASKVAVGIVLKEGRSADVLKRWFSDDSDVRYDASISAEILAFIQEQGAKSVVAVDGIIGCPHEEGVDYPDGEVCPECPYWAGRDRFTGELIQ